MLVAEPNVQELPAALAGRANVRLVETEAAIAGSDIAVLLVGHAPFRQVEAAALKGKDVIDFVGLWR